MNLQIPQIPVGLLQAIAPYGGRAQLVGPAVAYDATPDKGSDKRGPKLAGWSLAIAIASTPAGSAAIHELGKTVQTAIDDLGVTTVRVKYDGKTIEMTGPQAGLRAADALIASLNKGASPKL